MKEFKILEFKTSKANFEDIENVLAEKSNEGWEVVSMSFDMSKDLRGTILVLIQKQVSSSIKPLDEI
ncbi:MAG: DUF4177 domain-containing protein [Clostridia bacterium]|nr:DUF4177 domain-containing protein [Clostridia bacterium]